MSLKEKIIEELNDAIKEKKDLEVLVLRQLKAAILNKEKEKRFKITKEKPDIAEKDLEKESQLIDEETLEAVTGEAKKRKEAIPEFEKGKRLDLAEKEKKELEILKKYLPEQLSEEDIKRLAQEVIKKVGAKDIKDIGKIMSGLMPIVKGKADGSLVSKVVKEGLGI